LDALGSLYCREHQPQPCYGDDHQSCCSEVVHAPILFVSPAGWNRSGMPYRLAVACTQHQHRCSVTACILPHSNAKTRRCAYHEVGKCLYNACTIALFGSRINSSIACGCAVLDASFSPLCDVHRCRAIHTSGYPYRSPMRCGGPVKRISFCKRHAELQMRSANVAAAAGVVVMAAATTTPRMLPLSEPLRFAAATA